MDFENKSSGLHKRCLCARTNPYLKTLVILYVYINESVIVLIRYFSIIYKSHILRKKSDDKRSLMNRQITIPFRQIETEKAYTVKPRKKEPRTGGERKRIITREKERERERGIPFYNRERFDDD